MSPYGSVLVTGGFTIFRVITRLPCNDRVIGGHVLSNTCMHALV